MNRSKPRREQVQPLGRHVEFDVVPVADGARDGRVFVADVHVSWDDERRKWQRVEVVSRELILDLVRVPVACKVATVQ
ncbi:MAG: hypothetical protein ACKVHE_26530 [Planctomycetales bacterium]|jgi:hypothetical protein